jgi:hypothetical protein
MVEEEPGQPFVFRGRWRGRKLWVLACAAALAAALAFTMVWVLPSQENDASQKSSSSTDRAQVDAGTQEDEGQPREPDHRADRPGPTMTPGDGGSAPGIVIDFPDPAGVVPEPPPPGGYGDVGGRWILDMSGSAYGLTNCHIILNEDGTISSPPDYDQVFHIAASSYRWRGGDPSFSASLQLMLKMGSSPSLVPVQIELSGIVSGSLLEISGDFTASPQGEIYAPYGQTGAFRMHR